LRAESLGAIALLAALVACHQKMAEQPRCEPLAPSALFADGKCARDPVAGTVPHGGGQDPAAQLDPKAERLPVAVTHDLLARGRERFDIYCSPCHDRVGTGRGMIVRRGYTAPPSFHEDRLRAAPVGHFVDVMTRGWGAMPSYATQIPPADRLAIAAYIRALQRSQHATVDDVPPEAQERLRREAPPS
jgi:mono/diheme cytochrome c family protein